MSAICQYGNCKCEATHIVMSKYSSIPMPLCFKHALDCATDEEPATPILKPDVQIPPNLDDKVRKLHDAVYGQTSESNWRACRSNWYKDAQWLIKHNTCT